VTEKCMAFGILKVSSLIRMIIPEFYETGLQNDPAYLYRNDINPGVQGLSIN
jgi:hypothetical protein